MKKYKRLQGEEWYNLKDKLKLKKYIVNKNGNIKGFYVDNNETIFTHWLNNEEIIALKENGEYEMKKVYKFNKEWLDLLLENKDNENANFMLSDNDTRILLTYIEILQNRIDKAIEYIEKNSKQCLTNKIDEQPTKVIGKFMWHIDDLLDILKESGE